MLNLDQFEGHTPGEWWACCSEKVGGKAHFVFGQDAEIAICQPCHNDPNEPEYEPLEGIVTMEDRRKNALLMAAAPALLAELRLMRELVEEQEALIDEIFGNFPSMEDAYDAHVASITTLKERLGYEK